MLSEQPAHDAFFMGNRSGKVDENLEVYDEIPSDVIPFEQAPAMKSKEITEHMVQAMASKKFTFLRCNYPNGDMVGIHQLSCRGICRRCDYLRDEHREI